VADRGEALLDGWRGSLAAELLDVGGDVQRFHVGDRRDAGALAPDQKLARRLRVGAPRVSVADLSGEEFPKPGLRALASGSDEDRSMGSDNRGELIQDSSPRLFRCHIL
jgi:hypothetical protein